MKKSATLLISIWIISSIAIGQHAFIPEFQFGSFDKIDLITAVKTNITTNQSKLGASDFGPGGVLYAINEWTNEFYILDTVDGSTTLLGTNPPPADHKWTGMAYDEVAGIMYGVSYHDVTNDFYSSLYTIDVTDGSYIFIGSQTNAPAIACIAIDGIGDMYAMQLGDPAKLYKLDKTTGGVIGYQGSIGHWAGGPAHGMDWSHEEQAMYLTTDVYFGIENTLRIIDLSNANTTIVGDLGLANWIGTIAVAPILTADFWASTTDLCIGGNVDFTDESRWATSWLWTFEGGAPATSTDQNPTVTYNTAGIYNVTLEVSNGVTTNTLYIEDMITVRDIPVQPTTPDGTVNACGNEEYIYTTLSVPWATTYQWDVQPVDAGIITGSDTSAIFESAGDWNGSYTIKVMASNDCGSSPWSSELSCTLAFTPQSYFVEGGGGYCEGGSGLEVTLDGSEMGVDYELFFDSVSTGTILAGTGSPLSFGYQTDEGIYSVTGYAVDCSTPMFGEAYIYLVNIPAAASQPTGPDEVCSNNITDYQTEPIPDADTLIWILSPSDAGVIIGSGENISVEWLATYTGFAYLSVYGSNDCGDGDPSDDLEITVNEMPSPEVIGETIVCEDDEYAYSTENNTGSTYVWEVQGGEIVSGSGTIEIIILWTTVGPGTVLVTETSAASCEGTSDTLNVVIDECIGINELSNESISLYPNPATDKVTITLTLSNTAAYEIVVFNQFGQQVYTAQANADGGKGSHQINIVSLPTGLYIVKMTTSSNQVYQSRFEVVR